MHVDPFRCAKHEVHDLKFYSEAGKHQDPILSVASKLHRQLQREASHPGVESGIVQQVVGFEELRIREGDSFLDGIVQEAPTDLRDLPAPFLSIFLRIDGVSPEEPATQGVRKPAGHPPPDPKVWFHQDLVIHQKMAEESGEVVPLGLFGRVAAKRDHKGPRPYDPLAWSP